MKKPLLLCMALASACALLEPNVADACGGCFTPPPRQESERSVVTDHRMALSISTKQTVLWDQIRYSGDPAEFAWVLPVRAGAKLELSNDAFFTALDTSTQPVVYAPRTYGGAMGCGLTGCSSSQADSTSAGPGAGQVQVLSQSVVGPYETVTLRATDPGALRAWLKSHAFAIPDGIAPTIDAYVAESFDFLALRLRPDCGERAMQPVRIVTPGADPTLPLRMVAAGVGAKVGLTLYVISEGRYQPSNFPHGVVDASKVRWDRVLDRSNYEALTQEVMAGAGGRTWVAEYANKPQLFTASDPRFGGRYDPNADFAAAGLTNSPNPGLADTYYAQCRAPGAITPPSSSSSTTSPTKPPDFTPCRSTQDAGVEQDAGNLDPQDAGVDSGEIDAGDPDAGDVDAGDDDGGADASAPRDASVPPEQDSGTTTPPVSKGVCLYLDDLDTALRGLHPRDVWVTRFRASLPSSTLGGGDLELEPADSQTIVSNVYYASAYADEDRATSGSDGSGNSGRSCISAPKRRTAFGSWVFAMVCGIGAVSWLRRRARPRP